MNETRRFDPPKPLAFTDVRIGDELTFVTADNGFGGTGDLQRRTGTVTSLSDKAITLHVGGGEVTYGINSRGHGHARPLGATARLRRSEWNARSARLTQRITKLSYTAERAVYRDTGIGVVWVFWTSDPEVARALADKSTSDEGMNALWNRDDVEFVAEATRYYQTEGASFSGWVVVGRRDGCPGDPISTKGEAMESLKYAVTDYFKREAR